MKNQLKELLEGIVFKFEFYSEGLALFSSTISKNMMGNYKDFEVEVFTGRDGEFFSAYETFESLSDRFKLFEVREVIANKPESVEVLFHQKYDENIE